MHNIFFNETMFHFKNGETRQYDMIQYNRKNKSFIIDEKIIFTKEDINGFTINGNECKLINKK